MILALLTSVVLSQNACVPPWRALGTSLEEVRVEGERVVVCANNGGAYPALAKGSSKIVPKCR